MDGIQDNSLFRPVPISRLQADLAGFYSKTSRLVKEKFEDMIQFGARRDQTHSPVEEANSNQQAEPIRPSGLGRLIDIYA